MANTRRERITDAIDTLVSCFLYYDRKEDEDLPPDSIEEAVKAGEITVDEMINEFAKGLKEHIK